MLLKRPITRKEDTLRSQNSKYKRTNSLKRGKTRTTKTWLVLPLDLIGWVSILTFLNQSQRKEKQNHCYLGLLSTFSCQITFKKVVISNTYSIPPGWCIPIAITFIFNDMGAVWRKFVLMISLGAGERRCFVTKSMEINSCFIR